jgi:6,7-dimethyl-8-ribityllumazine synthase
MKPKVKIVHSNYYYHEVIEAMVILAKKNLKDSGIDTDTIGVPGSFEIPYEIARSIKEVTINNEYKVGSFKGKGKEEIRDNIVQIAKLSQLNLNNQCIYSGYLALGCIIKGQTINHQSISTSIFTNLQRISIENNMPIGNGIFNANNMDEAKKKYKKCANQAVNVIHNLV